MNGINNREYRQDNTDTDVHMFTTPLYLQQLTSLYVYTRNRKIITTYLCNLRKQIGTFHR